MIKKMIEKTLAEIIEQELKVLRFQLDQQVQQVHKEQGIPGPQGC